MIEFILSGLFIFIAQILFAFGFIGIVFLFLGKQSLKYWLCIPVFLILCFMGYFSISLEKSKGFLYDLYRNDSNHIAKKYFEEAIFRGDFLEALEVAETHSKHVSNESLILIKSIHLELKPNSTPYKEIDKYFHQDFISNGDYKSVTKIILRSSSEDFINPESFNQNIAFKMLYNKETES